MNRGDQAAELARRSIEAVAAFMGAAAGQQRLEFELEDGVLKKWYLHQAGGAKALDRFVDEQPK